MAATSVQTTTTLSTSVALRASLASAFEAANLDAFTTAFIAGSPASALSAVAQAASDVDALQNHSAATFFKEAKDETRVATNARIAFTYSAALAVNVWVAPLTDHAAASNAPVQRSHAHRTVARQSQAGARREVHHVLSARPDVLESRTPARDEQPLQMQTEEKAIVAGKKPPIPIDESAKALKAESAVSAASPITPPKMAPAAGGIEKPAPTKHSVSGAKAGKSGPLEIAIETVQAAAMALLAEVASTIASGPIPATAGRGAKVDPARAGVQIFPAPRVSGSSAGMTPAGRSVAERGLLHPGSGWTYFAKPGEAAPARSVTALIERAREADVIVLANLGNIPVREYYAAQGGQLHFVGWQEQRAETPPLPAIPPREYCDRPLLPLGRGSIFAFVTPGGKAGGETAFRHDLCDLDDPLVGEQLALLLQAQLRKGPSSLADAELLDQFNTFLRRETTLGATPPLSAADWKGFLAEALRLAVRRAKIIDERGLRSIPAIQDDAARILTIDAELFEVWQAHFDAENISAALFTPDQSALEVEADDDPKLAIADALGKKVAELAHEKFATQDLDEAISWSEETDLQWTVARMTMLPGTDEKMQAIAKEVSRLANAQKRRQAGRVLALAVKHSAVNELPANDDGLAAPFSKAEIKGAILGVMTGKTWDIASHRSFRAYLTTRENRAINLMIAAANYDGAIEQLRQVDVFEVDAFDKMLTAVQATGHAETVFDKIFEDMVTRSKFLPADSDVN